MVGDKPQSLRDRKQHRATERLTNVSLCLLDNNMMRIAETVKSKAISIHHR